MVFYQKKWYFSHFPKIPKEIHTLSPEPDAPTPAKHEGWTRLMGAVMAMPNTGYLTCIGTNVPQAS